MSAAEWIARRREIEQSATPGVWVAYHGGDTANIWGACPSFPCPEGCIDPMGHPDVLSMDETPRGDVEASWLPDAADLKFIADARTSLPKALDALEAVLAGHRPVTYSFSWTEGVQMHEVCPTCHDKAGVHECGCWRERDEDDHQCAVCSMPEVKGGMVSWPCMTVTTITETLTGGESDE